MSGGVYMPVVGMSLQPGRRLQRGHGGDMFDVGQFGGQMQVRQQGVRVCAALPGRWDVRVRLRG